jgi:hypothetical protein
MFPLNYNSFENVQVEVEHQFDLERIGNYGYYMEEELRNACLIKFLDLDLKVYRGLVRQFIANAYTHGDIIFSTNLDMHAWVDLLLPYYNNWINENLNVDSFLFHEDAPTEE